MVGAVVVEATERRGGLGATADPAGLPLLVAPPSPDLRPYVDQFWFGLGNADTVFPVLPDGEIDLVIAVDQGRADAWLFGTTTMLCDVPLRAGAHYLGVRFRPGQARHFIAAPADALTNAQVEAWTQLGVELASLPPQLARLGEQARSGAAVAPAVAVLIAQLERLLRARLAHVQPDYDGFDRAIALLARPHAVSSPVRMAAEQCGHSLRQFERVVSARVGVPARTLAGIARFRGALGLITGGAALADAAAEAGYADQSHMTYAFQTYAGMPPARLAAAMSRFHKTGATTAR